MSRTFNRQSALPATSPLRQARKAADLSPEGLADRAGVSLRTIERIEAGEVRPHRATLRAIAAALEVDAEELQAEVLPA